MTTAFALTKEVGVCGQLDVTVYLSWSGYYQKNFTPHLVGVNGYNSSVNILTKKEAKQLSHLAREGVYRSQTTCIIRNKPLGIL